MSHDHRRRFTKKQRVAGCGQKIFKLNQLIRTEQEGTLNNLINKYIILVRSCCLIGVFVSAKTEDFTFSDERSSASIAS